MVKIYSSASTSAGIEKVAVNDVPFSTTADANIGPNKFGRNSNDLDFPLNVTSCESLHDGIVQIQLLWVIFKTIGTPKRTDVAGSTKMIVVGAGARILNKNVQLCLNIEVVTSTTV